MFTITVLHHIVTPPGYARQTRALLFTETDQFGNVVDPKTGTIISVAGGRTPFPLPPWLDQTPAILQWMNRTKLTDTARRVFSSVSSSHWRARDEEEGSKVKTHTDDMR